MKRLVTILVVFIVTFAMCAWAEDVKPGAKSAKKAKKAKEERADIDNKAVSMPPDWLKGGWADARGNDCNKIDRYAAGAGISYYGPGQVKSIGYNTQEQTFNETIYEVEYKSIDANTVKIYTNKPDGFSGQLGIIPFDKANDKNYQNMAMVRKGDKIALTYSGVKYYYYDRCDPQQFRSTWSGSKFDPCGHVYVGKRFKGRSAFAVPLTLEVKGFSKETQNVTVLNVGSGGYEEMTCMDVPE